MQRLKSLLAIALAVTLGLATPFAFAQQPAANAQSAPQPWKYQTKRLTRAEVDALLATPDRVLVIDVRRPDEVTAKGGFPVYLNVQNKDLEKHLAYIPKDRVIVTVSNHALRAGAAGDLLAGKGFNVAGATGSEDYEAEGGTIVRITPPQKTAAAPVK